MECDLAGRRLAADEVPQGFVLHSPLAGALGPHQQLRSGRIARGQGKQIMNVRLAIAHAHQPGLRAQRLDFGYSGEAVQPLHALLFLDRQLLALLALAVLVGIACPALGVEDAERRPLDAERHGVVQHQANRLVARGVDRAQSFRGRMMRIVSYDSDLYIF